MLLERRRAELAVRLDKARRVQAPDGLDRYTRSLVEHRTRSIEHDLEWVDELITTEKSSHTKKELPHERFAEARYASRSPVWATAPAA